MLTLIKHPIQVMLHSWTSCVSNDPHILLKWQSYLETIVTLILKSPFSSFFCCCCFLSLYIPVFTVFKELLFHKKMSTWLLISKLNNALQNVAFWSTLYPKQTNFIALRISQLFFKNLWFLSVLYWFQESLLFTYMVWH